MSVAFPSKTDVRRSLRWDVVRRSVVRPVPGQRRETTYCSVEAQRKTELDEEQVLKWSSRLFIRENAVAALAPSVRSGSMKAVSVIGALPLIV